MEDTVMSLLFVLLLLTPTLLGAFYPYDRKQRVHARFAGARRRSDRTKSVY